MKKDFFHERRLKVLDASFGAYHTLVLTQERETGRQKVFGCGSSEFGQLCKQTSLISYDFQDLSSLFSDQIESISCGSLHSLFLT